MVDFFYPTIILRPLKSITEYIIVEQNLNWTFYCQIIINTQGSSLPIDSSDKYLYYLIMVRWYICLWWCLRKITDFIRLVRLVNIWWKLVLYWSLCISCFLIWIFLFLWLIKLREHYFRNYKNSIWNYNQLVKMAETYVNTNQLKI